MTLQRAYLVNMRFDIKDRRIAGALLTPPRGTDSLSIRCLDTCCFLARQLRVARKPWTVNIWLCPSVLHLSTLSNTWAMTTDLCGNGDKWRKRTGFLMWWTDSRDRHRFEKHCLTTKGGNYSFSHSRLFALPSHPVFHVPRIVCRRLGFRTLHQCQRTALLQSDTGFSFGRCGFASSLFPQSRTAHTTVATLRAIVLQPVPSKFFTTVVLFDSQSRN